MHETLTPMGSFVTLLNMMLNSIFGGVGVGVMNLLAMAMLTVFLVGLMVGRTPEFLGKKLEVRQISLLALVILLHPVIILLPTALALVTRAGRGALTHAGFRGLTQALYEFTSAAANNGSTFAGLRSNTPFWNLTTALVMLLGRYSPMLMLLAAAGQLLAKPRAPAGPGTLRIETPLFGGILLGIIIVVGALTFFPVLALGPVAEHLSLFKR
jgi:K+-transporting ATPase ATPase A chain